MLGNLSLLEMGILVLLWLAIPAIVLWLLVRFVRAAERIAEAHEALARAIDRESGRGPGPRVV